MAERKQLSISCKQGNLWERIIEASRKTGMGHNEIAREILEVYLDRWLEAQEAKLDIFRRQGINVEQSLIKGSIIANNSEISLGSTKRKPKRRR